MVSHTSHLNFLNLTETEVAPTVPARSSRLAFKLKRSIVLINTAEVTAVEAQGNYILLRREFSSYRIRGSISKVAEGLTQHGFIRIHRSALVNPAFVEEIRTRSNGQYSLRVRGAKEYRVTRTYRPNLRLVAQFWIGTTGSLLGGRDGTTSNARITQARHQMT